MSCYLREHLNHLLVVPVSIPVFVIPKHTGGLWPILNLKQFNCYLHIPSFKMPTIQHVCSLFIMMIMLSPLISRMLIYIFLLLSIIIILWFVWCNMPYKWKVSPFGLALACRDFTALTKPILFLCHHKGFHIVVYLDDILVLVHSKWAGKRASSFLCSLLVHLGLHINLSKSDLCLTQTFVFLGLCWDTVHMSVSFPPNKLADIQQLALSLLQTQPVTVNFRQG